MAQGLQSSDELALRTPARPPCRAPAQARRRRHDQPDLLIAQWPEGQDEPVKYWISNLPGTIPAKDLVRLAKSRWRIEHDYRELKTALGLDHFEGRSFTGWHRHVTFVTAAHLFLTEQQTCPKVAARA
ncbi:transposase [Streptomyces sp. APSN-46.1]|uniref:transposase n=1 Tax=Streptomyces sp. APSN-46.1 TaxID=2929049 RepID=UPI0035ABE95D